MHAGSRAETAFPPRADRNHLKRKRLVAGWRAVFLAIGMQFSPQFRFKYLLHGGKIAFRCENFAPPKRGDSIGLSGVAVWRTGGGRSAEPGYGGAGVRGKDQGGADRGRMG